MARRWRKAGSRRSCEEMCPLPHVSDGRLSADGPPSPTSSSSSPPNITHRELALTSTVSSRKKHTLILAWTVSAPAKLQQVGRLPASIHARIAAYLAIPDVPAYARTRKTSNRIVGDLGQGQADSAGWQRQAWIDYMNDFGSLMRFCVASLLSAMH
jgi:hypothetical protein